MPVRKAVSYHGLFTASWFGVREKHCSRLEIYDRLRVNEQAHNKTIIKDGGDIGEKKKMEEMLVTKKKSY